MAKSSDNADRRHMEAALGLARRGLGRVWPNPAVGCVLVRDGRVVGRGWTRPGGRPHAETEALGRAGGASRGATAYVSLEPCSHHGQTPPCADALIAAGIARAVVAVEDPDPRVSGRGVARLERAGVPVTLGVCRDEAAALNAGFFLRIREGRPLVTWKTATSLDGKIATHIGESQWITGEDARARAHLLRANHDAIAIGVGTAVADDPQLTCRLPGLEEASPVRVVIDGRLRLPLTSRLVAMAGSVPTWFITRNDAPEERRAMLRDAGVEVIPVGPGEGDRPHLGEALRALGARGITRLLLEGGSQLAAAFLRDGCVDRIAWFRGPYVFGGDGLPAAAGFGVEHIARSPAFARVAITTCGVDTLETFARRP
ncbi:MAG TPA: bifunctional diaminohydroxyphosphoribosylaminopyrimidine deaminase/5-amino-6-(5-phosphoribosylamino)uracil reductase RibD [Alphaproteobacteria bacterium]|nr:bifunctional diaminohydroxyphosphoribosylaminopyrimidine deaminase/5-amino-6-(5-phosphoribosylamino)uracil reductase RibD [Alphaproteobacteria bacterium]